MSERKRAERYYWIDPDGSDCWVGDIAYVGSLHQIKSELLRVVRERDAFRALVARQHALLRAEETFWTETEPGPHCPTCGGVHDGDQQLHTDDCERAALLLDRDGHQALADSQAVLATTPRPPLRRPARGGLLMGIALPEPHEPKAEDRALLRECRNLAYQLKTALVVLEDHSDLWQMADVIYRDLAGRARTRKDLLPEEAPDVPLDDLNLDLNAERSFEGAPLEEEV